MPSDSLQDMKIRIASERRSPWRERFVEIAREVEAGHAPRALVAAAGLRLRLRTSAFAVRRTRAA